MPLPGSWISSTYLLKNKCKAINKLFIALNVSLQRKDFFVSNLKILLGHSNMVGSMKPSRAKL
jgi:hypothetical protein